MFVILKRQFREDKRFQVDAKKKSMVKSQHVGNEVKRLKTEFTNNPTGQPYNNRFNNRSNNNNYNKNASFTFGRGPSVYSNGQDNNSSSFKRKNF